MNDTVPITPDVLRWARESAGLTVDDVVKKINRKGVTHQVVEEWEEGFSCPTYSQLERLAYDLYKRPLALFFFPEPPEELSPKQSFRTLPEYEIDHLPSRMRMLLRKAGAFQMNLYELYDSANSAKRNLVHDLSFKIEESEVNMAKQVREYLSITLDEQVGLKSTDDAFKFWREKLEELGIFIFKDAFKSDSFSGFCLYDDEFPVIYVNNSKSMTRQIFTLFHELAHLLFKTGGVDTRLDDYIDYIEGDALQIEVLCNRFAGEFLVPSEDFSKRVSGSRIDDALISELANTYHVSREVILRRFMDRGSVGQEYYESKVAEWASDKNGRKGSGGNYYSTQGAYLGVKYIEKAFSCYYKNQITAERLADYLDVKVKNIDGMEALLYRRGTAA